ncbi:MAG: acyl carrier protein [Bryobacteraceae bacterium]|jgi:acyl carrier protein
MDAIRNRLATCFQTVFPDLPEAEIPAATQAAVAAWDSVAAITLVNVIEDEFGIQVDFDLLGELDSFGRIHEYLRGAMQAS